VEAGLGLQMASRPPLADAQPPPQPYNQASAGDPRSVSAPARLLLELGWRPASWPNEARWNASVLTYASESPACVRWASKMSAVTTLPPLPSGTSKVDVVFPGLTTLAEVAVTPAPNSAFRSAGPAVRDVWFWTYRPYQQHPEWVPRDWPTRLPRTNDLERFQVTVDAIVR
jgi:hypothetical protein